MSNPIPNPLNGDKSIRDALKALSHREQNTIAWSAARAGAVVIRDRIKQNYTQDNPKTKINISEYVAIQRASKMANEKQAAYRVGVQGGAKNTSEGRPTHPYYWRYLEFGTRHIAARPFVRPAAEQSVNQVYMVVSQAAWKGIERVLRKATKDQAAAAAFRAKLGDDK